MAQAQVERRPCLHRQIRRFREKENAKQVGVKGETNNKNYCSGDGQDRQERENTSTKG